MLVRYRPAVSEDLEGCGGYLQQAYNDLRVRHGVDPSIPLRPPHFQRFALAEDPAGLRVAESEDGALAGFGLSWMRRDFSFLAQLFVRPDVQAAGIGRALFGYCLQQAERAGAENRALITLDYNRASIGLYIRNGMYPREPLYRMSVPTELLKQRRVAGEHEVSPIAPWPAPSDWLGRIDDAVLGFRRGTQHAFQIGSAARAIRVEHHGRPAGYAYMSADGHIGPLAVAPGADAQMVVEAAVNSALDLRPKQLSVIVPGKAERVLRTVSEMGFRIEEPMVLMSARPFVNVGCGGAHFGMHAAKPGPSISRGRLPCLKGGPPQRSGAGRHAKWLLLGRPTVDASARRRGTGERRSNPRQAGAAPGSSMLQCRLFGRSRSGTNVARRS